MDDLNFVVVVSSAVCRSEAGSGSAEYLFNALGTSLLLGSNPLMCSSKLHWLSLLLLVCELS